MRLLRLVVCGIATMSLIPAALAQDSISRMEARMANTTAVLTEPSATPVPTPRPVFPTLNQNGAAACGTACDPCGRTIVGGIERLYLRPDFGDESFSTGTGPDVDFDRDWEFATRSTLGFVNACGNGIRGRYFDFDAETSFSDLTIDVDAENVDGVYAASFLEAKAADLEFTRNGCFRGWNTVGSLGARYARLSYDMASQGLDLVNDSNANIKSDLVTRDFDGVGITGSLDGRRAVRCGSGLALYWNARGSAVWGDSRASFARIDVDADSSSVDVDTNTESIDENETLLIGEFQVGFDFSRPIACIRSDVVVRAGFEYQVWDLGNDTAEVSSVTTENADPLREKSLNLYGPSFSIGIRR